MSSTSHIEEFEVSVGGLSREELRAELAARGVGLNEHAELLLATEAFDLQPARVVAVTTRTPSELGRPDGATLPEVFRLAQDDGLLLCPLDTGPYLRLALTDQEASTDSVMSAGRSPQGALTLASEVVSPDDDHPKGFYLRVVDGRPWLRGYRCSQEYVFGPDDRFVFSARGGRASAGR